MWVLYGLSAMKMHMCAVRLCALVYFFAFLGNAVDGPVMWLCLPPVGGSTADELVRINRAALVPALVAFFRPAFWPALALCWPAWRATVEHGGSWFFFGWDEMMEEIGFLAALLSATLTFYDGELPDAPDAGSGEDGPLAAAAVPGAEQAPEASEETQSLVIGRASGEPSSGATASGASLRARPGSAAAASGAEAGGGGAARSSAAARLARAAAQPADDGEKGAGDGLLKMSCRMIWGLPVKSPSMPLVEVCDPAVGWSRSASEVALALAGFRLFVAAGLIKMRQGSQCWKDLTCLYDHFETQPMPNPVAWYFHNWSPHWLLRVMQWFAIDLAECKIPYLLLAFFISMGPVGLLHAKLRSHGSLYVRLVARFPARLVASTIIMAFVFGMFSTGNYAFLHPLAVVSLVASMGTLRGTPVALRDSPLRGPLNLAQVWYRRLGPWIVLALQIYAFLPSLPAYSWIVYSDEHAVGWVNYIVDNRFVGRAAHLGLGIAYNHHAYFAGAVHERNEMVLFADLADGRTIELDIPCKVGSVARAPCVTSPLHRRFAWQWWFLALGTDPTFLQVFLYELCARNAVAWDAVERSEVHGRLEEVKRVSVQMYNYHYSKRGSPHWWSRQKMATTFEQTCVV